MCPFQMAPCPFENLGRTLLFHCVAGVTHMSTVPALRGGSVPPGVGDHATPSQRRGPWSTATAVFPQRKTGRRHTTLHLHHTEPGTGQNSPCRLLDDFMDRLCAQECELVLMCDILTSSMACTLRLLLGRTSSMDTS